MYLDMNTIGADVTSISAIKNSIRNILLTPRGSLPGKPRFGSDLYKIIFSQLDYLTETMAIKYVEEALREFEDRINISSVEIKKVEEYNRVIIDIYFSYKNLSLSGDNAQIDASTSVAFSL